MITENQAKYIDYLCSIKNTEKYNVEFDFFTYSFYKTTKEEASEMIQTLLNCENKSNEEMEINKIRMNIYKIISKKRTKRGQKLTEEMSKVIGKPIWAKSQSETLTDEEILKLKDFKY